MAGNTRQPPASCYLLDLPKELRLEIYEYLVKPDKYKISSLDTPSIEGLSERQVATTKFFARSLDRPLHVQLLRACRLIHDEAKPLLFKPTAMELSPSYGSYDDCAAPRKPMDLALLNGFTNLNTLELSLATVVATADEDIAHSTILAKHLNSDVHIKDLTLTVDDYVNYGGGDEPERSTSLGDLRTLLEAWKGFRPSGDYTLRLLVECDDLVSSWMWKRGDDGALKGAEKTVEKTLIGYAPSRQKAVFDLVETVFVGKPT